jgi:hypothetical protein
LDQYSKPLTMEIFFYKISISTWQLWASWFGKCGLTIPQGKLGPEEYGLKACNKTAKSELKCTEAVQSMDLGQGINGLGKGPYFKIEIQVSFEKSFTLVNLSFLFVIYD